MFTALEVEDIVSEFVMKRSKCSRVYIELEVTEILGNHQGLDQLLSYMIN